MHKNTRIVLGVFLTVVLSSCGNFQMPESLAIKTDAKFQVPLGVASYDLSQTLNSESMRNNIQGFMSQATVYDYISPDSPDILNYMIRFPGMSVPVDIGSVLQNMNLDGALGDFNQDFPLRAGEKIDLPQTVEIPLPDFSSKLQPIEASTESPNFTEGGSRSFGPDFLPTVAINCANEEDGISFDRMYYESGKIKITFTENSENPFSPDFAMLLRATLKDKNGNVLSNSGDYQDITKNKDILLPMTNANGLTSKLEIEFEGKMSGGNSSETHTIKASASFVDLMPKKITGFTATDVTKLGVSSTDLDNNIQIDLTSKIPDAIKSIEFENAKVEIKIPSPDGWSGVKLSLNDSDGLKIDGATSSTLSQTPITDGNILNTSYNWNATINTATSKLLTAKIHPQLSVNNATITLKDGKTDVKLSCNAKVSLTKLKSARVDLAAMGFSGFSLPTNGDAGSVELPSSLTDFINTISFKAKKTLPDGTPSLESRDGFGLRCSVTNTLPARNNIDLKLQAFKKDSSSFYFNTTGTIEAGANNKNVEWKAYPEIKFPKSEKYLSFNILIDNANDFTLKDIELGKDYNLGIKLEKLLFDWDSADLNLSSFNKSGDMDFNFSVDSLMEGFSVAEDAIKNIKIHTFPMYLFAQKSKDSDLFRNMDLSGKLYLSYKQGDVQKYYDFMNQTTTAPTSKKKMNLVNPVAWPSDSTKEVLGNKSDPNNLAYYMEENHYTVKAELNEILSMENVSEMKLNYELGIDGGENKTLYASQMTSGKEESLAVDYGMLLSFDFDLKAPISVNIMEFANKDYNTPDESGNYSDLLQRSDASSTEEFASYVDLIKYMGFDYTVTNNLLKNLDLSAKIVDTNGNTGLNKTLNFKTGRHAVTEPSNQFTAEDIKSVMTNYPFHPDITIQLGRELKDSESSVYAMPERLTVSRSGMNDPKALGAQIIAVVQMNDDEPISVWQK